MSTHFEGTVTADAFDVRSEDALTPSISLGVGSVGIEIDDITLVGAAGTMTSCCARVTTEVLTALPNMADVFMLDVPGVTAADMAIITHAYGGTNTVFDFTLIGYTQTDAILVAAFNHDPVLPLNGTILFNVLIIKQTL